MMRYRVTRISVHQTSKTLAVVYGLIGLIFVPIGLIVSAATPAEQRIPPLVWLLFPIVYLVIGYLGTVIGSAAYNLIARLTGGVEATLQGQESPPAG